MVESASVHPQQWNFGYPVFHPETREQLREWLAEHHDSVRGAWIVAWKPHTGRPAISYEEFCEELICWGWIDSTRSALDEDRALQLASRRRARSTWTRLNRRRVDEQAAAGRMTEAGWRAVDEAKASGWWTILDPVEDLVEPEELRDALDADPEARRHWDAFPASPRKAMLWWVYSAVKDDTRARRVATIVKKAARGERAQG